ncbi:OLC1v1013804C1 [Oldenlandia corymbosa var. corymbosa]|uniref:Dirigent protein n=1 Tax=Oldenlandia corymbosa var. corymbosa TaxID=529605 RepID=A0AAV1DZK2_OLDCO|nr:OLC1v1013804C1 [Oldenlandia corymbosa var. corymbosa]
MMKIMLAVLLAIMVMNMASLGQAIPDDQSPAAVEKWFRQFPYAVPKLTKLHFYLHNIVSESPPDSVPIAQAASTANSPTKFGLVTILDGPLANRPFSKNVIGYGQGLFTLSSQEESSTLITVNFVFTAGKYKGSTLSVLGRNVVFAPIREFPIIGGTGDFRLARGVGTCTTNYLNSTSGDDILDVNFVFYRYVLPGQEESDSENYEEE